MSLLDRILKKQKKEEIEFKGETDEGLPEEFERFKVPSREPPKAERESVLDRPAGREIRRPPEPYLPEEFQKDLPPAETEKKEEKEEKYDRIDMILQKLETIEARLKVIEHKLER